MSGRLPHLPRAPYVHDDGRFVSIGFTDSNDTLLKIADDPTASWGDVERAREWCRMAARFLPGPEPGDDYPETREQALQLARDWAEGRRSHNNIMLETEGDRDNRPQTLAAIVQADAAEVTKWVALAQALPSEQGDARGGQ